ncbi:hypothetical protein [Aliihoeflea sp. 2WW]|uniref:hypothetical protein n=1 Tax=Aliihoeflea sp. 2WW TaxID=1381123 RepID=UPI0004645617|nr:hypothetical protein [Aliihoeflea sp. 2WW]
MTMTTVLKSAEILAVEADEYDTCISMNIVSELTMKLGITSFIRLQVPGRGHSLTVIVERADGTYFHRLYDDNTLLSFPPDNERECDDDEYVTGYGIPILDEDHRLALSDPAAIIDRWLSYADEIRSEPKLDRDNGADYEEHEALRLSIQRKYGFRPTPTDCPYIKKAS